MFFSIIKTPFLSKRNSKEPFFPKSPSYLLKKGINTLPCIGDGRQSGTSGSPSILNASPESAMGGGLAILKTGDLLRVDLNKFTANMKLSDTEIETRKQILSKQKETFPESQSPWQEIFREKVSSFSDGMTLKGAEKYQDIARKYLPRDNH